MTKKNKSRTRAASIEDIHNLIFEIENSINSIAWGCSALVHTLYDVAPKHVDGVIWVADKIKDEAIKMQAKYNELFQAAAASRKRGRDV